MRLFFFSFLFLAGIYLLVEEYNGGFGAKTIAFDIDYYPVLPIKPLTESQKANIDQILSKQYSWLGQGRQVVAFLSEDGKYVLKIFKFKRLRTAYSEHAEEKRIRRIEKLFSGYHLGYTEDTENTGLIYVHLNKTNDLNKTIIVKDRLGFSHQIDLDTHAFAIQEYATMTKKMISDLLTKGKLDEAIERINQLFDLYLSEYNKGIVDADRNVMSNTGFLGNRAIRLDLGQLRKEKTDYRDDLEKVAFTRIYGWVLKYYPQYAEKILPTLETRISDKK